MNTSSNAPGARKCQRCGAEQLGFSPAELCGRCLFDAALGEEPGEPLPGPKRFKDYELLGEIARGGMGVVFRARQLSLNRIVAVKMILQGELAGERELARFRLEAEAAARLKHPNIVAIHEVGESDGQHFFSMDYVEGRSLATLLRDGPLPAPQAARYMEKIARAVHYGKAQQYSSSIQLLDEVFQLEQARLPRDHPSLLVILYNLARAHDATGHHDQALKLFDDALDRAQANHGDDHRTLLIMQGKAMALRKSGRTNEALELAERVSALTRAKRGPDHPETLSSMNNLGVAYLSVRQFSQAVAVLQEAVLLYERRYPPDSPEPLGTMENLLVAYEKNEPGRSRTYTIQCWLGETLARQKKYSEAEQYYLSGYAGLKKLEATDPSTARQAILEDTASHIDKLYETWGEIQKAAHWRENLR